MADDRDMQGFLALVAHYGLSPDKPGDGWKMAFALYMDFVRVILAMQPSGKVKTGPKPSTLVEDGIMLACVTAARERGDPRTDAELVADLAKHNGWPARSVRTRLRRLQYMRDRNSGHWERFADKVREEVESGDWPTKLH
ncbi:MAG TPA: hypothetical protein VGF29_15300 [Hyphomicrobiaceae bacterium]|jgi:hypothetical protein